LTQIFIVLADEDCLSTGGLHATAPGGA
jgi:hypothetical protein